MIDKALVKVQIGQFPILPGFRRFGDGFGDLPHHSVDEVYIRGWLGIGYVMERYDESELIEVLKHCHLHMKPLARLDIRCTDFENLVSRFKDAKNNEERNNLQPEFLDKRSVYWESKMFKILQDAGFEGLERLPVSAHDLHIMAYSSHEKDKEKKN